MIDDERLHAALAQPGEFYLAPLGCPDPGYEVRDGVFVQPWPQLWIGAGRELSGLTISGLVASPGDRQMLILRSPRWLVDVPALPGGRHPRVRLRPPIWAAEGRVRFRVGWESRGWDVRLVLAQAWSPDGVPQPRSFVFVGDPHVVAAAVGNVHPVN